VRLMLQVDRRAATVMNDSCDDVSQSASLTSSSSSVSSWSSLSRKQPQKQQQPAVAIDPLYHSLLRVKLNTVQKLKSW